MKKTKKSALRKFKVGYLAIAIAVFCAGSTAVYVHADQFDAQINQLQQQNNSARSNINNLATQAGSYQAAISQLQNQINAIQSALYANQAKQASLQSQIDADKQNIIQQKQYLGEDIKTMYIDGQLSTIEELATSKDLSDYVDKQEYRSIVQDKVDSLLKQIATLETQLQQQKNLLDVMVNTEKEQNDQLATAQAQQQQLLSYNQAQQDNFNAQIQSNQSQIAQLRQAQAAANRRLDSSGQVIASGSCGGSYPATASGGYGPWGCNYAHTSDNVPGCAYMDSWGMCNRECVSYTAWMVYETYGIDTSGFGNANQWPGSARSVGIATGSTPKVGSVAIYMGGSFGHAMWVVGVSGSQVHVYSYNDGYDGNFYDHWVNASGLTYLYFGG